MNLEEILAKHFGEKFSEYSWADNIGLHQIKSAMTEAAEEERKFWEWANHEDWVWWKGDKKFHYWDPQSTDYSKTYPELKAMYYEHLNKKP